MPSKSEKSKSKQAKKGSGGPAEEWAKSCYQDEAIHKFFDGFWSLNTKKGTPVQDSTWKRRATEKLKVKKELKALNKRTAQGRPDKENGSRPDPGEIPFLELLQIRQRVIALLLKHKKGDYKALEAARTIAREVEEVVPEVLRKKALMPSEFLAAFSPKRGRSSSPEEAEASNSREKRRAGKRRMRSADKPSAREESENEFMNDAPPAEETIEETSGDEEEDGDETDSEATESQYESALESERSSDSGSENNSSDDDTDDEDTLSALGRSTRLSSSNHVDGTPVAWLKLGMRTLVLVEQGEKPNHRCRLTSPKGVQGADRVVARDRNCLQKQYKIGTKDKKGKKYCWASIRRLLAVAWVDHSSDDNPLRAIEPLSRSEQGGRAPRRRLPTTLVDPTSRDRRPPEGW